MHTLLFRINVYTRLLILRLFSNQHALIRDYTFIRFTVQSRCQITIKQNFVIYCNSLKLNLNFLSLVLRNIIMHLITRCLEPISTFRPVQNSTIHVYLGIHVYYFFQKIPVYTFIWTPRLLGTGEYKD